MELRKKLISDLQDALNNINTLTGLIQICALCKKVQKVRDDKGSQLSLSCIGLRPLCNIAACRNCIILLSVRPIAAHRQSPIYSSEAKTCFSAE